MSINKCQEGYGTFGLFVSECTRTSIALGEC